MSGDRLIVINAPVDYSFSPIADALTMEWGYLLGIGGVALYNTIYAEARQRKLAERHLGHELPPTSIGYLGGFINLSLNAAIKYFRLLEKYNLILRVDTFAITAKGKRQRVGNTYILTHPDTWIAPDQYAPRPGWMPIPQKMGTPQNVGGGHTQNVGDTPPQNVGGQLYIKEIERKKTDGEADRSDPLGRSAQSPRTRPPARQPVTSDSLRETIPVSAVAESAPAPTTAQPPPTDTPSKSRLSEEEQVVLRAVQAAGGWPDTEKRAILAAYRTAGATLRTEFGEDLAATIPAAQAVYAATHDDDSTLTVAYLRGFWRGMVNDYRSGRHVPPNAPVSRPPQRVTEGNTRVRERPAARPAIPISAGERQSVPTPEEILANRAAIAAARAAAQSHEETPT